MAALQVCCDPAGATNPPHKNCSLHFAYTNRTGQAVETAERREKKRLSERKKKRFVNIAVCWDMTP
jgi:hypothetical protein